MNHGMCSLQENISAVFICQLPKLHSMCIGRNHRVDLVNFIEDILYSRWVWKSSLSRGENRA